MHSRYSKHWDFITNGDHHGAGTPPLWTLDELSRDIGISLMQLCAIMRADPTAPRPMVEKGDGGSKKRRYDRRAVMRWWRERNAKHD